MATSKVPAGVLSNVKAICAEVVAAFPDITHVYGYNSVPDHDNRRCIDFMVINTEAKTNLPRAAQVKLGDAIADYQWANRHRLGLVWQIWNKRCRRTYDKVQAGKLIKAGTWAAYLGPKPHEDHVHAEFTAAGRAIGSISDSYPKPTGPKIIYLDEIKPGQQDSDSIWFVQDALRRIGYPVSRTGDLDQQTIDAGKRYQRGLGDDVVDGVLGPKQIKALLSAAAVTDVQIKDPPGSASVGPAVPARRGCHVKIIVASNNALRKDDQRRAWPLRRRDLVRHYQSTRATVLLLQEISREQMTDIVNGLGPAWTWFRSNIGTGPLAIAWDTRVWERQDQAEAEYDSGSSRYVLSVKLRHEATSKLVWFDCTHLKNNQPTMAAAQKIRTGQAKEFVTHTKGTGARVFGADLNSSSLAGAGKPRTTLVAAGWHLLTGQKGVQHRDEESHHGMAALSRGQWIDDLGWRGLEFVSGGQVLTDKTDASDHNILWAELELEL